MTPPAPAPLPLTDEELATIRRLSRRGVLILDGEPALFDRLLTEHATLRESLRAAEADLDEHRAALAETRRGLQAVEDYGRQKFDTSEGQRKAQSRRIMQQRHELTALQAAHVQAEKERHRFALAKMRERDEGADAAETALRQAQADLALARKERNDQYNQRISLVRDVTEETSRAVGTADMARPMDSVRAVCAALRQAQADLATEREDRERAYLDLSDARGRLTRVQRALGTVLGQDEAELAQRIRDEAASKGAALRDALEQLRQAQAERDAAYRRGRDDERTDVVTLLRDLAEDECTDDLSADAHAEAADMIDLGEHVKTKPTPTTDAEPRADRHMMCRRESLSCGVVLHRWAPSPDAGPFWHCSECGAPTPDKLAPTEAESRAIVARDTTDAEEADRGPDATNAEETGR